MTANAEQLVDFTGGLDPAFDLPLQGPAANPLTFETFNNYFVDGANGIGANFGLFNIKSGALNDRGVLLLPNGCVATSLGQGTFTDVRRPGGSVLQCTCLEPFRRWNYQWNATATVVCAQQQRTGVALPEQMAQVSMDIDIVTTSEPWTLRLSSGPSTGAAQFTLEDGTFEGKYEQLMRVTGMVRCDDRQWKIDGAGLRTHVRGPRDMSGMHSHTWTGGLFPDGRGFALKRLCAEDGVAYFNEAFVTYDGRVHRAEIVECPALVRSPDHLAYAVRLKSDLGTATIKAQNLQTDWHAMEAWGGSGTSAGAAPSGFNANATKLLSFSTTSFTWDGLTGYGFCELSG